MEDSREYQQLTLFPYSREELHIKAQVEEIGQWFTAAVLRAPTPDENRRMRREVVIAMEKEAAL